MTKDEIKALIAAKIAGQGTNIDAASVLPSILEGIIDLIPTLPEPYELPVATDEVLGGVKVGENLSITEGGVLSAKAPVYDFKGLTLSSQTPYEVTEAIKEEIEHSVAVTGIVSEGAFVLSEVLPRIFDRGIFSDTGQRYAVSRFYAAFGIIEFDDTGVLNSYTGLALYRGIDDKFYIVVIEA